MAILVAPQAIADELTWTSLGPEGARLIAIRPSPHRGGEVWALTRAGAFRSGDFGRTWHRRSPTDCPSLPPRVLTFDAADPQTLVAATGGAVWRTRDAGATWQDASVGLPFHAADTEVAADPFLSGRFYLVSGDTAGSGLYATDDAGESWQLLRPGVIALAVAADGSLVVIRDDRGVEHAEPTGNDWRKAGQTPSDFWMARIAIGPDGRIYGWGSGSRLLASTDGGGTWEPITSPNRGGAGAILDLVIHPRQPRRLYAATSDGVFHSGDHGAAWQRLAVDVGPFDDAAVALDPLRPWRVFAGSLFSGSDLLISTDGGDTWQPSQQGLAALPVQAAVKANGALLVAAARPGLELTTDASATWSRVGLDVPGEDAIWIRALHTIAKDGSVLAVGKDVYRSQDGGVSWQSTGAVEACPELAFDFSSTSQVGRHLAISLGTTLCASANRGDTWEEVPVRDSIDAVDQVVIDPSNPRHLLARGRRDVFRQGTRWSSWESWNRGRTWTRLRVGPYRGRTAELLVDTTGQVFLAGVAGLYARNGRVWELRDRRSFEDVRAVGERLYAIFREDPDSCRLRVGSSDDGGRTWRRIGGSLDRFAPSFPQPSFAEIVVENGRHHVLLSTGSGLLVTTVSAP